MCVCVCVCVCKEILLFSTKIKERMQPFTIVILLFLIL